MRYATYEKLNIDLDEVAASAIDDNGSLQVIFKANPTPLVFNHSKSVPLLHGAIQNYMKGQNETR